MHVIHDSLRNWHHWFSWPIWPYVACSRQCLISQLTCLQYPCPVIWQNTPSRTLDTPHHAPPSWSPFGPRTRRSIVSPCFTKVIGIGVSWRKTVGISGPSRSYWGQRRKDWVRSGVTICTDHLGMTGERMTWHMSHVRAPTAALRTAQVRGPTWQRSDARCLDCYTIAAHGTSDTSSLFD